MPFARLTAFVLFIFAAVASFGWGLHYSPGTVTGLIASGLAFFALSFLPIPSPPG